MLTDAWPEDRNTLEELQRTIGRDGEAHTAWTPPPQLSVAAVFVASKESRLWVAAVVYAKAEKRAEAFVEARSLQPYEPGLLALREGATIERALQALDVHFDVIMANATGRDHPRRAGLALHIGAVLDVPTVGVTDRPLIADGPMPLLKRGSRALLTIGDQIVGARLRTRADARPVCVHAAWRTDADVACEVVRRVGGRVRTPRPMREARRLARQARAEALTRSDLRAS